MAGWLPVVWYGRTKTKYGYFLNLVKEIDGNKCRIEKLAFDRMVLARKLKPTKVGWRPFCIIKAL